MPWTGETFTKHNKGLHGARADHAARIANATLRSGVPEGESIAIANKWAARHHAAGGIVQKRDSGGGTTDPTAIGGFTQSSATSNPMTSGMIQRYASMSTEQLQELSSRLGGTSQGQIIQKVLQQRLLTPQASQTQQKPQQTQQQYQQQPQQQTSQTPQTSQTAQAANNPATTTAGGSTMQIPQINAQGNYRKGGTVKRDMGGGMSLSMADPWWTRSEARGATSGDSGFLSGETLGQADARKTQAPGGSYVVPAAVVSGLGDGNSLAGAKIMNEIVSSTGPWGTKGMTTRHGNSIPRAPSVRTDSGLEGLEKGGSVPVFEAPERAAGGVPEADDNAPWSEGKRYTAVDLSDGEYVISPEDVDRIGGGDRKRGHRILDKWVMSMHKKYIEKLKKYPGPVVPRGKGH